MYDEENRISSIPDLTAAYKYDADGNRIAKSVIGSWTLYWHGVDGNTLVETDGTGAVRAEYVYFNGKRIARNDHPGDATPEQWVYYLGDHLGSTSMEVDASTGSWQVDADVDYFPYGQLVQSWVQDSSNHYWFTGKERDTETGLDYFGARYYGSGMGRFMTPDWAAKPTTVPYAKFGDPQTLNLYGYVRNNPLRFVDADGHDVVLGNDKDEDRIQAASRLTGNLSAAEKKMFTVGVDAKTGRNQLMRLEGPIEGERTKAFTRLAAEVGDHSLTITVKMGSTFKDGNGQERSVAVDAGGGVTIYQGNGNSLVLLAPEENLNPSHPPGMTFGLNGGLVPDPVHLIAGHETMGHAFEYMFTGHSQEGSTRHFENEMRDEQGFDKRKE